MRLPPTFEVRLARARMISSNVRELHFDKTDGTPVDFAAGQWVNLHIARSAEAGGDIRRAYSIASAPDGSSGFDVTVTLVDGGPGSTFLHRMQVGDTIEAIGPQGFFVRPLEKAGPSLFVATGTGLTPMRSMLHAAIAAHHDAPITLVFGVRGEDDILYRDEIEALARTHANVRFLPSLSRGSDAWTGLRGYVQTHVRELYGELAALNAGTPHVYVCGLARMVTAVRDLVRKDMGLPRELVHTERYD